MKMTKQEKYIVQKKFCSYCIKILRSESLNYWNELEKIREKEVSFSDLLMEEWNQLYTYDELPKTDYFQVMDTTVPIKDERISEAIERLPERKRSIILMAYFLDMTEMEIADCLNLVQSTVHYHKADSLRLLKKWME